MRAFPVASMSFQRTARPCYTFQKEKKTPIFGVEKSLRQKKTKKIQILKEHESHELHESGKEKEKLTIIRDKWC
jgi:hypothetical protein